MYICILCYVTYETYLNNETVKGNFCKGEEAGEKKERYELKCVQVNSKKEAASEKERGCDAISHILQHAISTCLYGGVTKAKPE